MSRRGTTTALSLLVVSAAWAADTSGSIGEFGLVLDAGGKWSKQQRDDPSLAVYRGQDGREQITLSFFPFKSKIDSKERRDTVARLVEHRQAAERRGMDGKATFGPVKNLDRDGLSISFYCGVDQASGQPFATMVLASQESAWTLFYETVERTPKSFCARAETMFSSIRRAVKR